VTFSLETLQQAQTKLYEVINPTPQFAWPLLQDRFGFSVSVKHENFLPVGSFKLRGALAYLQNLKATEPSIKGVIAATRGNFGQGVAYAASQLGLTATVVTPIGNSPDKNRAMRAWGAELIEIGDDFQHACELMADIAQERQLHIVPSFSPSLLYGTASIGLEWFEACPDLDVVYSSIGLGSNICGLIAARDALGLKTKIIGVVSEAIPAYAQSFEVKTLIESPPGGLTIADGLDCRKPNPDALAMIFEGLDNVITVSEDEIKAAMRVYFDDTHMIAEGAGAAPLAGLWKERQRYTANKTKAGVLLCGGNVTAERYFSAWGAMLPMSQNHPASSTNAGGHATTTVLGVSTTSS
jgi:threonine dehydratase